MKVTLDRRTYLSHFAALVGGTASAQIVNLAAYPVLGRLYSPADFGLFALFVTICAIPGAVACGRLDFALPVVRGAARFGAYWLCLGTAFMVGLVSAIVFEVVSELSAWDVPGWSSALVGATIFLTGYCVATASFMLRHDRYGATSAGPFVRTLCAVLSQAAFALLIPDSRGLALGFSFGLLAQALFLASRSASLLHGHPPRPRDMRLVACRYRRQVSIDIPSTVVGAASNNVLNPLLLSLYNASTVGHYSLANRIAIVPLQLFNDSLAQVFFQKAARANAEHGGFWRQMKFSLIVSALLSLVALAGIWLFAKPFIHFYLGETWDSSADMLITLAPYLALQGACMSVATGAFILKRPHWVLYHNLATMTAQLAATLIAWVLHLDVQHFLIVLSWVMGAEYLCFTLFLAFVVRQRDASRLRHGPAL